MPEGDSIHRLALRIAPILVDRAITSFTARRIPDDAARSLVGKRVVRVAAHGKNLLVHFDDGRILHVHLRMQGRVFIDAKQSGPFGRYAPDLYIGVAGGAIVGRRLPVCRLLSEAQARRARSLADLGPDLATAAFDEDEALRRLRTLGGARPIGEALLAQRIAAGIGNVYKSEVLFLEGVDPRRNVASLDDATLRALLRRASVLLRRNIRGGPRVTRPSLSGPRLWVYGRSGRPCLRCATPIATLRQGAAPGRSTFCCPTCQPVSTVLS